MSATFFISRVSIPDLDEVSGGWEIKCTAAPKKDDEEGAKELCEEGGHHGNGALLLQVFDPQEGNDGVRHAAVNFSTC